MLFLAIAIPIIAVFVIIAFNWSMMNQNMHYFRSVYTTVAHSLSEYHERRHATILVIAKQIEELDKKLIAIDRRLNRMDPNNPDGGSGPSWPVDPSSHM